MKLEARHSNQSDDSKRYDTDELRKNYLREPVFVADESSLVYSHNDRVIVGGITPVKETLELAIYLQDVWKYICILTWKKTQGL